MISFGGGEVGSLETNLPLVKGASLVGVDCQAGKRAGARLRRQAGSYQPVRAKKMRPRVRHVLSIERFDEAAERAMDRATVGRVVVTF